MACWSLNGLFRGTFAAVCLVSLLGCQQGVDKALTQELQRTYNTFIQAVEKVDREGLTASAYFPGLEPIQYREHVKQLIVDYLLALKNGKVGFDQQGVLLARFLGIGHNRYQVVSVQATEDRQQATMRISIHFAYDANIRFADLEKGSLVYVPKNPWPEYYQITIGGENELPREHLQYLEIDIEFQDFGQGLRVTRSTVLEGSIKYVVSFESFGG